MKFDAMLELAETTEVHTVWFVGDGRTGDWLGILSRDSPLDGWKFSYRFRHYASSAVWEDEAKALGVATDERSSVYSFQEKDPTHGPDNLLDAAALALSIVQPKYGPDVETTIVPINGGAEKFAKIMQQQKFMHTRRLAVDEHGNETAVPIEKTATSNVKR